MVVRFYGFLALLYIMSSDTGGGKTANFFSYAMRIGWLLRVLNIHALSKVILNIHDFSSWRLAVSAVLCLFC